MERGLDPMTTNLVVADPSRSDKTICLAVSPSMKKLGVSNRCRVFQIPKDIRYIMAPPRMQKYIDYAAEIYGIYLRYISRDDIHVYSIDEVFMDVTPYLGIYGKSPREMAVTLMEEVYDELGIRATAGIGTNLYLTKIALDITAKHARDFIGELDEESYKRTLWDHRPITDFWRIGPGVAGRLAKLGVNTMGELAHFNEDVLYDQFGIDAELLIDHAWGIEPTTIADIKGYKNKTKSLSSGQVLMRDYRFEEGRIIIREMVEQMCLELMDKGLRTSSMTMSVRYAKVMGLPRTAGSASTMTPTNSAAIWTEEMLKLYDNVIEKDKLVRGFMISANDVSEDDGVEQLTFFDGDTARTEEQDRKLQKAMLEIKEKFGKNAIFKSADLQEGATALERNRQIGGHKSGE